MRISDKITESESFCEVRSAAVKSNEIASRMRKAKTTKRPAIPAIVIFNFYSDHFIS